MRILKQIKRIPMSFFKNQWSPVFRRNKWLLVFLFLVLSIPLLFMYFKGNGYECFGSYANNNMQGAIDILSVNTLEPIYRIGLIREMDLFENPALRDVIENQVSLDTNPDDAVNALKGIIQSDLNKINDVGSECETCGQQLTDALSILNSSTISSTDKLDLVKKMNAYEPQTFTKIMDVSNYTDDVTRQRQIMDLIAYLRLSISNPIMNVTEAFTVSPFPVPSRPSYTKNAFESACEILRINSISPENKIDEIKKLNVFDDPAYRSTIDDSEVVTADTVNALINLIERNISQAPDDFSKTKMSQAINVLRSNGLVPSQKISVLDAMNLFSPSDYIYIMNSSNYTVPDSQLSDLITYLNCADVERIKQQEIAAAAAAARKAAEEAAAAAKKAAEEAAAAAKKAAEEAAAAAAKEAEAARKALEDSANKVGGAVEGGAKKVGSVVKKAKFW